VRHDKSTTFFHAKQGVFKFFWSHWWDYFFFLFIVYIRRYFLSTLIINYGYDRLALYSFFISFSWRVIFLFLIYLFFNILRWLSDQIFLTLLYSFCYMSFLRLFLFFLTIHHIIYLFNARIRWAINIRGEWTVRMLSFLPNLRCHCAKLLLWLILIGLLRFFLSLRFRRRWYPITYLNLRRQTLSAIWIAPLKMIEKRALVDLTLDRNFFNFFELLLLWRFLEVF